MKRYWVWVILLCVSCDGEDSESSLSLAPVEEATPDVTAPAAVKSDWCQSTEAITLGDNNLFGACEDPALAVAPCGARVNLLTIGADGIPGEGLDVDGNPDTCAPTTSCKGGIDNQLSILSGAAQAGVDEALESGTLMLFLEFVAPPGGPGVFTLKMHVARIDEMDESCDWQTGVCQYRIRQDSYDEDCTAPVVFNDVTVEEDGSFKAGAGGVEISLNIPLFGVNVSLPVKKARLEGEIEWDESGLVSSMSGLLVGGIPKLSLEDAIEGIPEEEFKAGTSLDKATILLIIEDLIVNDLDLDGDGIVESASFGAKVGAIPGIAVGWE